MKVAFLVAALILVLCAVLIVLARRFRAKVENVQRRLLASQVAAAPDQASIPVLVREFAARNGGRLGGALVVKMVQRAEMRLGPGQTFFPIDATQLSGTRAPGFVWDARGVMMAIIPLRIVDSYVAGNGWLEVRIAGAIAVANATGPQIDKAEAMRFLAELPWNPDALINAAGLGWRQIDDHAVEVSMETAGGPARVSLLFDAAGDIVGIDAPDRPRAVGNLNLPTRWVGRFSGYAWKGAYRFPHHGEIGWILPEGEFLYWRGEIFSVTQMGAARPG